MVQANLENINDYLGMIFGKGQVSGVEPKKSKGSFADIVECKNDFQNKVNSIENIALAKKSLMKRTGKTEFNFNEIIHEISKLDKTKGLKYKVVG